MKTAEVLRLLQISRPTLMQYRRRGILQATPLPNGYFEYDDASVYKLLNKGVKRKTYLYARVSTAKQRKDLENQINLLKQWCFSSGYEINGIFSNVASGISFEKRKDFFKLLDEVMKNRVETVIITYKDRLSRVGFELFSYLFQKFGTKIIVISEVGSEKLDSQEVFEEIVSLLHCYAMKMYSNRKRKVVEDLVSVSGDE